MLLLVILSNHVLCALELICWQWFCSIIGLGYNLLWIFGKDILVSKI